MTLMMLDSFKAYKPHSECSTEILGHNKIQVFVSSRLLVDDLNTYIQMIKSQWATGLLPSVAENTYIVMKCPNEQYYVIVITLICMRPPLVRSAK